MKSKTKDGERLKRLATKAIRSAVECDPIRWVGDAMHPKSIRERASRDAAKKKLFDAIDELTSIDLTPRAVGDML